VTAFETTATSPAASPATGDQPPAAALAWAQTHALRATADLLDRISQPSLLVTVTGDQISILVPDHLASRARRAAIVARLAAAVGARPTRTRAHAGLGWIEAQGVLAGHPLHIFTPVPADAATPVTTATTATTKEPTP
jgi:hypothetical protein